MSRCAASLRAWACRTANEPHLVQPRGRIPVVPVEPEAIARGLISWDSNQGNLNLD